MIQSRSAESVLREVRALRRMDDFRGVISDVGGPTANMYKMRCREERIERACRRLSCVHPGVCENLVTDHDPLARLAVAQRVLQRRVEPRRGQRECQRHQRALTPAPDAVDLTFGLNFGIRNTAVLTTAFVTSVASPKAFDSEAILMLNIFYGRTRANAIQQTPPPAF